MNKLKDGSYMTLLVEQVLPNGKLEKSEICSFDVYDGLKDSKIPLRCFVGSFAGEILEWLECELQVSSRFTFHVELDMDKFEWSLEDDCFK